MVELAYILGHSASHRATKACNHEAITNEHTEAPSIFDNRHLHPCRRTIGSVRDAGSSR